ncbi:MAG TPA: alpha-xylosidase, partial [Sphingomicrobium sp.]|nr:alpha-xylosidase [Sphingomicrobium sp.]
MKRNWTAAALLLATSSMALAEGSYRRTDTGIVVTPDQGSEKAVRLQVYGDSIIRVSSTPTADLDLPQSLMVNAKPLQNAFSVSDAPGKVVLKTAKVSAEVDLANGNVIFKDAAGRGVLAESGPPAFADATAEGQKFLSVRQQFNRGTDEGFYGLGQHQNRQMNYNGEDVELAQHNMDIAVPFVVSTRNYGLLWDNNSITRFGDP